MRLAFARQRTGKWDDTVIENVGLCLVYYSLKKFCVDETEIL